MIKGGKYAKRISNILKEYPKSAWNTLDFENGVGPLAMISKDLDKLLT